LFQILHEEQWNSTNILNVVFDHKWGGRITEIVSCPGIHVLGKYFISGDIYGYASLAILNYRYIIIKKGSKIRVYNRIDHVFGADIIEKLCPMILDEKLVSLLEEAKGLSGQVLLNWFYGGFILSIIHSNKIDLMDLEYVKPGLQMSVAILNKGNNMFEADIDFWSLLGYCFRKTDYDLLKNVSRSYGLEAGNEYILIPSWRNSLTIISKDTNGILNALESIDFKNVYRDLIIDNNGVRHIVKFNDTS